MVLAEFEKQARREGDMHGLPDIRLAVLPPNVLGDTLASPEYLEQLVDGLLPRLVGQLAEVK